MEPGISLKSLFSPSFWIGDEFILEREALAGVALDMLCWGGVIVVNVLLVLDRIWQSTSTEWLGGVMLALSIGNALWCELRCKVYFIYDRNTLKLHKQASRDSDVLIDTPIRSPNIRRRRTELPPVIDPSDTRGTLQKAKNILLRATGRGTAERARDCLELRMWDPHWVSERFLRWFSPGHVMAIWLLWPEEEYWRSKVETGPSATGELEHRLRVNALATAAVTALVLARLSAKHAQRDRDARVLASEACAETERYGNKKLDLLRRTALAQIAAAQATPPHAGPDGRSEVQSPATARPDSS
eukprot:tig00021319_g20225.t1